MQNQDDSIRLNIDLLIQEKIGELEERTARITRDLQYLQRADEGIRDLLKRLAEERKKEFESVNASYKN